MCPTIDPTHRGLRMLHEDLSILRTFESVEENSSESLVEVIYESFTDFLCHSLAAGIVKREKGSRGMKHGESKRKTRSEIREADSHRITSRLGLCEFRQDFQDSRLRWE